MDKLLDELVAKTFLTPQLSILGALDILKKHGIQNAQEIAVRLTLAVKNSQIDYNIGMVDEALVDSLKEDFKKLLGECGIKPPRFDFSALPIVFDARISLQRIRELQRKAIARSALLIPEYERSKLTQEDMRTLRYCLSILHELMGDLVTQENWTKYDLVDDIRKELLRIIKDAETIGGK